MKTKIKEELNYKSFTIKSLSVLEGEIQLRQDERRERTQEEI